MTRFFKNLTSNFLWVPSYLGVAPSLTGTFAYGASNNPSRTFSLGFRSGPASRTTTTSRPSNILQAFERGSQLSRWQALQEMHSKVLEIQQDVTAHRALRADPYLRRQFEEYLRR